MKEDFYVFNYSTRTRRFKAISYHAYSFRKALRRFKKNVRYVGDFIVWKNGSRIFEDLLGENPSSLRAQ